MQIDIIVIGSGFAGSVTASRFAEQGLKVLVLERGPWRATPQVKEAGIDAEALPAQNRPGLILRHIRPPVGPKQITLNKKGMLELHVGKGVKTVSSSSVGGGSHIWSALIARPQSPHFWNGWADGLSEEVLAPHYKRVYKELQPVHPRQAEDLPNHTSHAWRQQGWFSDVPEEEQYPAAIRLPTPYAPEESVEKYVSTLDGCDGMFGSIAGAKANAEAIYLLPYLNQGITVKDMHEVQCLTRVGSGYLVSARDHRSKEDVTFSAAKVVLAAGTMNTVKLLCSSQESGGLQQMPALGRGFGTNGDCLGEWKPAGGGNSALGTPVHGKLNVEGQPEEVTVLSAGMESPPLPGWLPAKLRGKPKHSGGKYQLVAMAADEANGTLLFEKDRLKLEYDINRNPVFEKVFTTLDQIGERSGARVKYDRKGAMTAHPLGGARIGESEAEGVIDGRGEVYNNPGLFITDGSVFPAATGAPPTFSIAAWSSYVAEQIISDIKPVLNDKTIKDRVEKSMYSAIVTYKPAAEKNMEDVIKAFEASIPMFSSVPGLQTKYYCFDEEQMQGTSVYIWESKEAAEKLYSSEVFQERFKQSFDCEPAVKLVPVKQVVDNR